MLRAFVFLVAAVAAQPCDGVCPVIVLPRCAEGFQRPRVITLEGYKAPWFSLDFVELELDLDPEDTVVSASLSFSNYDDSRDLELQGHRDLELLSLTVEQGGGLEVDDVSAHACRTADGGLVLRRAALPGAEFRVKTRVSVHPVTNTELFGLYVSDELLVTQNEAEGFRRITFFPDRPDVLSVYRTTLRADAQRYPVLLSNGNRVSHRAIGDGRHEVIFMDPFPKPCYLFAVAAGKLSQASQAYTVGRPCEEAVAAFHEVALTLAQYQPLYKYCAPDFVSEPPDRRTVHIRIWSTPENVARLDWALAAVAKAMLWDEIVFGRYYDLNEFHVVAVNDFNAGAMENKGLNMFNSALLEAAPRISTDNQYLRVRTVIAHEYFHNWSGDRVTVRDWFQLSLKEGFTVFRDQSFSSDVLNSSVTRIEDAAFLEGVQFAEDLSALRHSIRPHQYESIENLYTTTVYEKGAEVVRMYQTLLGWEGFRHGADKFFADQDGKAVTCEDFFDSMQSMAPRNISQFARWYRQVGTPEIIVANQQWDPKGQTFRFTVSQRVPEGGPLLIPLSCGLVSIDGQDISGTQTFLLNEDSQEFHFVNVSKEPVLAVNRGFGAPVIVQPYLTPSQLELLSMHDSCNYIRWKAGRQLLQSVVLDKAGNMETAETGRVNTNLTLAVRLLRAVVAQVLEKPDADLSAKSMELAFPNIASYETLVEEFDPQKLQQATRELEREVSRDLDSELWRLYHQLQRAAQKSSGLTAVEIGQRKMRNAALARLAAGGSSEALRAVKDLLHSAEREEEASAALHIAANLLPSPERDRIIDEYRKRAGSEPMLVDRWFAAQGSSTAPDTFARVKELMKLPEYRESKTPNRIRALASSFSRNLPIFHGGSGDTYDVLAAEIRRIDAFNPKVAARLATAFSASPKLPFSRRDMLRSRLQGLLAQPNVSRQLYEILSKALKEL